MSSNASNGGWILNRSPTKSRISFAGELTRALPWRSVSSTLLTALNWKPPERILEIGTCVTRRATIPGRFPRQGRRPGNADHKSDSDKGVAILRFGRRRHLSRVELERFSHRPRSPG